MIEENIAGVGIYRESIRDKQALRSSVRHLQLCRSAKSDQRVWEQVQKPEIGEKEVEESPEE